MIIIDPAPVLPFPLWLIVSAIAEKKMREKETKRDDNSCNDQKNETE